jgi:CheY-like chemotaxis protein
MPLRITVVEDNKTNQLVLKMLLQRMCLVAGFCYNGRDLINYLRVISCDLVFMDLQMPKLDGLEATILIRSGEAGGAMKDVRIITLTANASSGDKGRCIQAGMDAYLSKSMKMDLLHKKLRSFLALKESSN